MDATIARIQLHIFSVIFAESEANIFEGCALFLESRRRYSGKIQPFACFDVFDENLGQNGFQGKRQELPVIVLLICHLKPFNSAVAPHKNQSELKFVETVNIPKHV